MQTLAGHCHCNQIRLEFSTATRPEELRLRACQCSFCRKHGARSTSDPAGNARIVLTNCEAVSFYQFGSQTADFLVCSRCGVYAAAVLRDGARMFTVINANTLEVPLPQEAVPMNYEGETNEQRIARRRSVWTPAVLVENWGTFSQRRMT